MKTLNPEQKEEALSKMRAQFAENADGVLEAFAMENGLTTREVTECLPEKCCTSVGGDRFAAVMKELSTWGEMLLIVHTPDAIIECAGPIPPGAFGTGFFNLGEGSPIRGHIRAEACASISLVRRPFMGLETCSVQFFNHRGGSMYKVFVGRGEDNCLNPEQVKRFEKLWECFQTEGGLCVH